jgi:hypothetical protein
MSRAPSYKIVPKREDLSPFPGKHSVGPGNYAINTKHVRNHVQVISFGKEKREKEDKEGLNKPGPGNYDVKRSGKLTY